MPFLCISLHQYYTLESVGLRILPPDDGINSMGADQASTRSRVASSQALAWPDNGWEGKA